jgi:Bacterial PH domain
MNAQPVHEHEFEAAHGLPERLPAGERVVWQGSPDVQAVARHVFRWHWVAVYFVVLFAWHLAGVQDWSQLMAWRGTIGLAIVYGLGAGLWWALAWLTARTTVYTLTNRRVVMRIGIVLTVTYNLPLRCIEAADLHHAGSDGIGHIALRLEPGTRIAYLQLWPHARPGQLARPQPMLRCIAQAKQVAAILSATWAAQNGQAQNDQAAARADAAPQPTPAWMAQRA